MNLSIQYNHDLSSHSIATPDSIDNETLVEAIRSIRIEPRVSVTDINRVQGEMVSVDNWVGL